MLLKGKCKVEPYKPPSEKLPPEEEDSLYDDEEEEAPVIVHSKSVKIKEPTQIHTPTKEKLLKKLSTFVPPTPVPKPIPQSPLKRPSSHLTSIGSIGSVTSSEDDDGA